MSREFELYTLTENFEKLGNFCPIYLIASTVLTMSVIALSSLSEAEVNKYSNNSLLSSKSVNTNNLYTGTFKAFASNGNLLKLNVFLEFSI